MECLFTMFPTITPLRKKVFLGVCFVLIAGCALFFSFPLSQKTAAYSIAISSKGNFQSQQMAPVEIEFMGRGQVETYKIEEDFFVIRAGIDWDFFQNKNKNDSLGKEISTLMQVPIGVSLDKNGQAKSIVFSPSLESSQAEISLNLWRILVQGIFLPKNSAKEFQGSDLWGPALWKKAPLGFESDSILFPAGFSLEGKTKLILNETGPDSVQIRQSGTVKHILFQSNTINEIKLSKLSVIPAKFSLPVNQISYSAYLESDGLRNKIRSLKSQYQGKSLDEFLSEISAMKSSQKPTDIYSLVEAALLLFPQDAEKVAVLQSNLRIPQKVRNAILAAFVKSPDQQVQEFLRTWMIQKEFQVNLEPALLSLTFSTLSSPSWKETLEKIGAANPRWKNTTELMVCSLARELADPTLIQDKFLSPTIENIQCLGNAGFAQALPIFEKVLQGTDLPLKEEAVYALRFVPGVAAFSLLKMASKDQKLHSALFRALDLRLNRGSRDPDIRIFLEEIQLENNRPDLEKMRKTFLQKLAE